MTGQPSIPAAFADPARAARTLRSLHEACITSGSRHGVEAFSDALDRGLSRSADPDLALTGLSRFLDVSLNRAGLLNDLIDFPPLLDLVMTIFGSSAYFTDIVVREPALFRWLSGSDALVTHPTPESVRSELARLTAAFERTDRRTDAFRRFHRREILRIGTRDLLGIAPLEQTTASLSLLADEIIGSMLREAELSMADRHPGQPGTPFVVIGLGKLGGNELNYSSDVDLLFVYDEDGDVRSTGKMRITRLEYFNRLSELLIQLLSQSTQEGHLYRVDVRLRPESGAGPLARSLRSYLTYYESRGELWERQMLLKSRPVAGDFELGRKFIRSLEPFVFPRTFLQHPAEYVTRIKARIESAVGEERNVKLMPGGIRDVEFVVQTLQLLHAGKNRSLRSGNTLDAIAELGRQKLLAPDDESALREGYVLFRTIEHRLQARLNTQTHTIPEGGPLFESVARSVSLRDGATLEEALTRRSRDVRKVFEKVLGGVPAGMDTDLLAILEGGAPDSAIDRFSAAHGLKDVRGVLRSIRTLTSGSALTGARELDARVRDAFRGVAPDLFRHIASTPDPDWTLANVTVLSGSARLPEQMYRLMQEPGFRKLVIDVCAVSPRFARGLAADPLLLEALAADPASFATHEPLASAADAIPYRMRQELRAGVPYVLGLAELPAVHTRLTAAADEILRAVVDSECRKMKATRSPFAVFALGKYGSHELTFDADLDLLFITKPTRVDQGERLQHLASAVVGGLSRVSGEGRLYSVDVRLRPEGRNAPLAANLHGYRDYLAVRASLWERQSLTRLRFVAGDENVRREAEEVVLRFTRAMPLPAGWVTSIATMRRKMESRSRTHGRGFFDLKLSPGGMADIEFIAQMIVLSRGTSGQGGLSTHEIVREASGRELEAGEADMLSSAYLAYRRVEAGIRLVLEERSTALPEGPKLDRLAACLERTKGIELHSRLLTTASAIRGFFQTFCARLEAAGP